jgi:hypothetical protein
VQPSIRPNDDPVRTEPPSECNRFFAAHALELGDCHVAIDVTGADELRELEIRRNSLRELAPHRITHLLRQTGHADAIDEREDCHAHGCFAPRLCQPRGDVLEVPDVVSRPRELAYRIPGAAGRHRVNTPSIVRARRAAHDRALGALILGYCVEHGCVGGDLPTESRKVERKIRRRDRIGRGSGSDDARAVVHRQRLTRRHVCITRGAMLRILFDAAPRLVIRFPKLPAGERLIALPCQLRGVRACTGEHRRYERNTDDRRHPRRIVPT